MKTKEELCALKEEVETVSSKLTELSEEELSQVSGGKLGPGEIFGIENAWWNEGEWFKKDGEHDFVYTVCDAPLHVYSFIANRYWYNGSEAWPYGTCSFGMYDYLRVVDKPAIVHTEYTSEKPF